MTSDSPTIVLESTLFGRRYSVRSEPPLLAVGYREFPTHEAAHAAATVLARGNGWPLADRTEGGAS